ncbi:MAG: hypothetical protein IJT37_01300 [Lachnospiraceae bacterium]|nr:hypothetical protein [Lachnospiraceae bacterium]
MISPIFTTVVIGFLAIMIYMKATTNRFNTGDDQLIEEESRANAVRKKSLDDLDYISIPFEKLPFSQTSVDENKGSAPPDSLSSNTDDVLRQDENEILRLKDSRIVNFTGISNTELKSSYGAPNLTVLTEYDQNFTTLVRALDSWGGHLIERGMTGDARNVLEFAVECRTDLKSTYLNLADMYAENFEFDKLDHLIEIAGELNSLMREPILRVLKEKCNINNLVKDKKIR